jgi:hypothetical protein
MQSAHNFPIPTMSPLPEFAELMLPKPKLLGPLTEPE